MSFGLSLPLGRQSSSCGSWDIKGGGERALGFFHRPEQGLWLDFVTKPRTTFVQGPACQKWFSTGWVQALLWCEGQKVRLGRRTGPDDLWRSHSSNPVKQLWLFHGSVRKEKPSRAISSHQVWRSGCSGCCWGPALPLETSNPSALLGRHLQEVSRHKTSYLWSWGPLGYSRSWAKAFSIIIYIQISGFS